ncbi:MAG: hypothetical protein V1744_03895 [Candidatus Altiarchaeota archaeon]
MGSKKALNFLFDTVFRVGFIAVILAMLMLYMPLIQNSVNPLLEHIGFWDLWRLNPLWANILSVGLALMGVAIVISLIKGWVEEMINILFTDEKPQIPKISL